MISRYLTLLFLTMLCLSASAWPHAHAQFIKDSIYYTLDDGIMSPEEMQMEAQDIQRECSKNAYQRIYFNCECLAGAFLQQREKLGPMVMQSEIYKTITNSRQTSASCANKEAVAARVYQSCLTFTQDFNRTELQDNNDYCTCAANKTAIDFGRAPRLSSTYIQNLRLNAMAQCRDPAVLKEFASRLATERESTDESTDAQKTPAPTSSNTKSPSPSNNVN